jgi:hypothetical protein
MNRIAMKPKYFLACGTLAPPVYLGAVVLGGAYYPGYKPLFQAVSELIAAGAPNKIVLDVVFFFCSLLIALFSFGIFMLVNRTSSPEARTAAKLGSLSLAGMSFLGLLILAFPIDPHGSPATLSGSIHVVLASVMSAGSLPTVLLIGFWLSKQPSQKGLALYSFITAASLFVVGGITAVIFFSDNPLLGAFERMTFALFLQWLLILAWKLFEAEHFSGWRKSEMEVGVSQARQIDRCSDF